MRKTLILFHSLFNAFLPAFAFYFVFHDPFFSYFLSEANFFSTLINFCPFVIFIIACMQIPLADYWPKSLRGMIFISLSPFLFVAIYQLFFSFDLVLYMAELGMVYTVRIMTAYIFIIFFGPLKTTIKSSWQKYLFITFSQLIFIIPGIGAIYVFISFLLSERFFENPQMELFSFWGWFYLVSYLLWLILASITLIRQIKPHTIYP